jgi:thioredoxin-related protein
MVKIILRIAIIFLIAVGVAGLVVGLGWLDKRDDGMTAPILIRQEAIAEAKKQNKRLLLWFSANSADFAELMDQFHNDPEVAQVLGKYFVIKKVDIAEVFGGHQVYQDFGGDRGLPAMSLLDKEGNVLADSGQDQESNFGFPDTPEQLDAYAAAMKKACPGMTDAELQLLRDKLIEIRATYQPVVENEAKPAPSAGRSDCRMFLRTGLPSV